MVQDPKIQRRQFLVGGAVAAAGLGLSGSLGGYPAAARKLKYGVVGAGFRSRDAHLPTLRHLVPEVEIVALSDITPENLQAGLRVCGGKTVGYADHREMLSEHPDLDAVIVVVPNYKHAEISLDALNAGKHVLTEKPIATSMADAQRMIDTATTRGRILEVGFEMRYLAGNARLAELLRQGAIGDLEYVHAALLRGDWNPRSWKYTDPVTGKRTNWRYLRVTEGAALLEDGIHELDVIHWLVGAEPRKITALGGNNVYQHRQTLDNAAVLIEFANEVRCDFAFSLFTPIPDGVHIRLFGSKGMMELEGWMDVSTPQAVLIQPYHGKAERIPIPRYTTPEERNAWVMSGTDEEKIAWSQKETATTSNAPDGKKIVASSRSQLIVASYRMHQAFVTAIRTGKQPFSDGKAGMDAMHISLAATHSIRTGKVLDWEDEEGL